MRIIIFCLFFIALSRTEAALPITYDFEDVDSTCWASRPNGDENTAGCNGFTSVGKGTSGEIINRAGTYGVAYSGTKSNRIVYTLNEEESRYRVPGVDNDHIFIRQRMYWDTAYDFGFGEKIFRATSVDSVGVIYFDAICFTRSVDPPTGGKDNNASVACEPNGGSSDFISFSWNITRGQWYDVQVEFKLNGPGDSTGICRMWVNGILQAENIAVWNMRTSSRGGGYNHLTDTHNFNRITFGGWYSNSIVSGSDLNPNVPAIKYLDDVAAATTFISDDATPRWGPFGNNDIFLLKMGF